MKNVKLFCIWTSDSGDVVIGYFLSTALATILFVWAEPGKGIMRNIFVKLGILTSGLGDVV